MAQVYEKLWSSKVEFWEYNLVGDFLLHIYHEGLLKKDKWTLQKSDARNFFIKFINEVSTWEKSLLSKERIEKFKMDPCIGKLLKRNGFLWHAPNDSKCFVISSKKFFHHRRQRIRQFDSMQRNFEVINSFLVPKTNEVEKELAEENYEVVENSSKCFLEYKASDLKTLGNFISSDFGCYMCETNFSDLEEYEEHLKFHTEESGFECLSKMENKKEPCFEVFYELCKNSDNYCFTFFLKNVKILESKTDENDPVIVEKIVVVQSDSLVYAHYNKVPFIMQKGDKEKILLESNMFERFTEHPIVIVFYNKSTPDIRCMEQHHLLRKKTSSERISFKKVFHPRLNVPSFKPSNEERDAYKKHYLLKLMKNSCPLFKDFALKTTPLDENNFAKVYENWLKFEDIELIHNYLKLSQTNVHLQFLEDSYSMKLQIFDKSITTLPSVSDDILLTLENSEDLTDDSSFSLNKNYRNRNKKSLYGFITNVSNKNISFKCKGQVSTEQTYSVAFRPNRSNKRYQFLAIKKFLRDMKLEQVKRFLFPTDIAPLSEEEQTKINEMHLELNSSSIYESPEQLMAVKQILAGPRKEAPFIIYGPPGTGKTTTLVEAVFQLYKTKENSKILITSGSNTACDEVALRLCRILSDDSKAIIRIFSKANEYRQIAVNELLLENSNMYAEQFYPDVEAIHEYRIIICTLGVVGKLITGKFGLTNSNESVFSHVFVDEAATLTEVETFLPIVFCTDENTRLILAGDTRQLSPVLHSKAAKNLGMEKSLMERLLESKCYQIDEKNSYDTSIQTQLIRNYRSHPAIVEMFSSIFYENRLLPMVKDVSCSEVATFWHLSMSDDFPVIFHSVTGETQQTENCPSFFNREEIATVLDYVKELMYFGIKGKKVSQSDIGIISPYKSQYLEIQDQLNSLKWPEIETGSVETFQGREKNIIIVSFVKSNSLLGFLENPRRLNVAISRAKSFLILIGNSETLGENQVYSKLIQLCKDNNTFCGSKADISREIGSVAPSSNFKLSTLIDEIKPHRRYRRNRSKSRRNNDKSLSNSNSSSNGEPSTSQVSLKQAEKPATRKSKAKIPSKAEKSTEEALEEEEEDESSSKNEEKIEEEEVSSELSTTPSPNVPEAQRPGNAMISLLPFDNAIRRTNNYPYFAFLFNINFWTQAI